MMRKTYLLTVVLTVFLWGCGEAGVESDISKTSEIDFTISASDLNAAVDNTVGVEFDFADNEFSSYISDAQKFTLNRLEFEILELSNIPASTLSIEIRIDLNNNTASQTDGDVLLSVTNVPVANTTSPILLFSTDATDPGLASATVVAALEAAILSERKVEIELTSSKVGADLADDFKIRLLFDLTARVNLD